MNLLRRLFGKAKADQEGWNFPITSLEDRLKLYQQVAEDVRESWRERVGDYLDYSNFSGLCKDASKELTEVLTNKGLVGYVWSFSSDQGYGNHSNVVVPGGKEAFVIDLTITQFFPNERQFVFSESEYGTKLGVPPRVNLQTYMKSESVRYSQFIWPDTWKKKMEEMGLQEAAIARVRSA